MNKEQFLIQVYIFLVRLYVNQSQVSRSKVSSVMANRKNISIVNLPKVLFFHAIWFVCGGKLSLVLLLLHFIVLKTQGALCGGV